VESLIWPVSAVTGEGFSGLLRWVGPFLRSLADSGAPAEHGETHVRPDLVVAEDLGDHVTYRPEGLGTKTFVVRREKDGFVVEGQAVRRLVSRFDLSDDEAVRYVTERFDRLGVYSALRAQGAQSGDDVSVEGYEFEFR